MSARPKSRTRSVAAGAVCAAAAVVALARCADPTADGTRPHDAAASVRLDRTYLPPGLAAGAWRREDALEYGRMHTEAMEFARAAVRREGRGALRSTRTLCTAAARITRDYIQQSRLANTRAAWIGMRAALDAPRGPCAGQYDAAVLAPLADGAATAPSLSASAALQGDVFTTTGYTLADGIRAAGGAYYDQPDFNDLANASAAQATWLADPDRVLVQTSASIGIESYQYWRYNMDAWGTPAPPAMSALAAVQAPSPRDDGGGSGSGGYGAPADPDRRARAGALVDTDVGGAIGGAVAAAYSLGPAAFNQVGLGVIAGAAASGAMVASTTEMLRQLSGVSSPRRPAGGYVCRNGAVEGTGGWCVNYGTGSQWDT